MRNHHAFTAALLASLEGDGRVAGVVALGSIAGLSRQPDRFSDYDFFVVTDAASELRETTEWLPERDSLALWFRETPHGCKGIYDDGQLIEYAVFTPDELHVARANEYRVLLDRERIAERMAAVAAVSDPPPDPAWLHGMFLSHLLVASGRAQRGELASARFMLAHAMRELVALLGGGDDTLDPLRRFDHYALEQAMRLGPAAAARALLPIYEAECNGDPRAIAAVRARL